MRLPFFGRRPASAMNASGAAILRPYARPGYWHRHRRLAFTLLGFFAFFYGAFFALVAPYLLVQMAVPLVLLLLIVIWFLPERRAVPVKLMEWLFFAFLVALLFWPDYLALAPPGFPWITAIRLVMAPLALVFLISLSQSAQFRGELKERLNAAPWVWRLVIAFALLAAVSCAWSNSFSGTLSWLIVSSLNWAMIFFIACFVFSRPGRIDVLCAILWSAAIFVSVIGLLEARRQQVLWAGHIPSFLKIENPVIQEILSGSVRPGGPYRVQSKFTTPLGLAEFLSATLPFILFIVADSKKFLVKLLASGSVLIIIYVILSTDTRLGKIGMVLSGAAFIMFAAIQKWRFDRKSIIAPLALMGTPVAGLVIFVASFFVGRVRKFFWGTGMQTVSTEARYDQINLAVPKILAQPWGYGLNQGAGELNYRSPSGQLTIDNYYLSMILDLGIPGIIIYFGIFAVAIFVAIRLIVRVQRMDRDIFLLGVCTIVLIEFLVIKSVFSQMENHPLFFAVLGAVVALIYRISRTERETIAARPETAAPRPAYHARSGRGMVQPSGIRRRAPVQEG